MMWTVNDRTGSWSPTSDVSWISKTASAAMHRFMNSWNCQVVSVASEKK